MINLSIYSATRIYCEGLGQLLGQVLDFNIVDLASDSDGVVSVIADKAPDVFLLDIATSESAVLANQIAEAYPHIKIVALSVGCVESDIVNYINAGIRCYVPREASTQELIEAVRHAQNGECYCPPKVALCLFQKVEKESFTPIKDTHFLSRNDATVNRGSEDMRSENRSQAKELLTNREWQIGQRLAEGMSNKQIAADLCIEVSTVKNHVHNLLVKLNAKNRSQAVFYLRKTQPKLGSESFDLDALLSFSA